MGDMIAEEARELVSHLERNDDGKDVKVQLLFNIPVMNVLWKMVAGKRFQVRQEVAE